MADILIKIHRPVTLGEKFLGAPIMPGFVNIIVCFMIGITLFAFKNLAMLGIIPIIIVFPIVHGALIYIGQKEPHLNTLITTYHLTTTAPHTIGNKHKSKRIFHSA